MDEQLNDPVKPVLEPLFWKERLRESTGHGHMVDLRLAVYHCGEGQWREHQKRHGKMLKSIIPKRSRVLDVGCAYGRVIDLLPEHVTTNQYLGVDLSPDFLAFARSLYPTWKFLKHDLQNPLPEEYGHFDWAVCLSFKHMILGNCGKAVWETIKGNILKACDKILYLEFNLEESESGEIEYA